MLFFFHVTEIILYCDLSSHHFHVNRYFTQILVTCLYSKAWGTDSWSRHHWNHNFEHFSWLTDDRVQSQQNKPGVEHFSKPTCRLRPVWFWCWIEMRLDRPDAHQGLTFGPNGSWIQHSCFNAFCFPQMKPFLFLIFAYKYTTLNCDVTVVRQMCAYFYFVFLFSHAASHRTHRTHSVTHPLISWLSCITYCSLSAWKLTWTAATHHTWPGGSQCVCVFLCVPGALQSLASFSAWFSWWVLWRPCACACACAWRMGEGHVLACSAPPISILWPRAIQVGLQKCGAREMEFTRKQNGRCQRWRLVQENKREKKKTSESDGIKMPVLGKRRMIIWKWSCMFWIIRI